jgi:hypothetical protein
MHLKVFVKLKKTLKTLSSGQKKPKKNKKTQKKQKKTKKPKKPHWVGFFFFKKTFFSNPAFPPLDLNPAYQINADPDTQHWEVIVLGINNLREGFEWDTSVLLFGRITGPPKNINKFK